MWKLKIIHCTECQLHLLAQIPSTGLQHRHPSFNHCHILVTPQGPENCQLTSSFLLVLKQFVCYKQLRLYQMFVLQMTALLMPAQIKPKSFETRQNSFLFFHPWWMHLLAWVLGCFYSQISTQTFRRVLTTSVDSCTEIKSAPSVA